MTYDEAIRYLKATEPTDIVDRFAEFARAWGYRAKTEMTFLPTQRESVAAIYASNAAHFARSALRLLGAKDESL